MLSLVRGSRLQRRLFSIFLCWPRDGYRHRPDARASVQATPSSAVQLADETRLDSTQSSTPAKRHPGPWPIIRQSFNLLSIHRPSLTTARLHVCPRGAARACLHRELQTVTVTYGLPHTTYFLPSLIAYIRISLGRHRACNDLALVKPRDSDL